MNKFIKEQLIKSHISFNEDDTQIIIKKNQGINLEENNMYLVKLSSYMLHPPIGDAISINWNGNSIPKEEYYKVDIVKIMSNMVKINGIAYDYNNKCDLNSMWSGWVPKSEMEIVEKL